MNCFEWFRSLVWFYCLSFIWWASQAGERNGHGLNSEEQNGEDGSQEEPVVVDADSNDGAVLVNGNEPEEEWGTNTEGTPSA